MFTKEQPEVKEPTDRHSLNGKRSGVATGTWEGSKVNDKACELINTTVLLTLSLQPCHQQLNIRQRRVVYFHFSCFLFMAYLECINSFSRDGDIIFHCSTHVLCKVSTT